MRHTCMWEEMLKLFFFNYYFSNILSLWNLWLLLFQGRSWVQILYLFCLSSPSASMIPSISSGQQLVRFRCPLQLSSTSYHYHHHLHTLTTNEIICGSALFQWRNHDPFNQRGGMLLLELVSWVLKQSFLLLQEQQQPGNVVGILRGLILKPLHSWWRGLEL